MTDNEKDPLSEIWLNQEVRIPDENLLKSRWRKAVLKQWAFIIGDAIGLFIGIFATYYLFKHDYHWMLKLWAIACTAIGLVVAPIAFWLRRDVIRNTIGATENYRNLLLRQCKNNIVLSKLTKVLVVVMVVALFVWFGAYLWIQDKSITEITSKQILGLAFSLIWVAIFYRWAVKHKEKQIREIEYLESEQD